MSTFVTPKGRELPLLDLQGKPYLQVAHRILWFREDFPDDIIEVTFPKLEANLILARATISSHDGKLKAVGHRTEFKLDDLERAETGAIGRALGFLGYGTQFATEILDDTGTTGKLADAPVEIPGQSKSGDGVPPQLTELKQNLESKSAPENLGFTLIGHGKYKGKMFKDIPIKDLRGYAQWMQDQNDKEGKKPSKFLGDMWQWLNQDHDELPF